jgi:adenosylcobinamide-GDP ribazoletransferase
VRDDLVAAFTLLTRLPVSRFGRGAPDMAPAVWAFPIVGLVIGAMGGLTYWLTHHFGLPPLLGASWALAAMMLATGAFHEDGLADAADGFGGGRTLERKLEIMRDSRIGSYGALALMLSMLMRVAAIATLSRPGAVLAALMVAGMLARAAILLILILLRPARPDGLAAAMGDIPRANANIGLVLAVVVPFLLLPFFTALAVLFLSLGACLAFAKFAKQQVGGYSGDVLGAAAVIVECVALTVMVGFMG